jgi:shikimate dehydrogenase
LLGLIGAGIARSLTPAMHVCEARCQGRALHYQLIDLDRSGAGVQDLPLLLRAAAIIGFSGLNVTYPCKQAILPLLDEVEPSARAIGAVNTVVLRDGRSVGHNTDSAGWAWGFRRALPRADLSRVLLVGAGGAGSAIAHALHGIGARSIAIHDADTGRARRLAADLARHGADAEAVTDLRAAVEAASGLVQATPVGMDKLPGMPLPAEWLHARLWVAESIYFPLETELVRAARALGCSVVDGGAMAVGQALLAFRLFLGLEPDAERVERHFRRLVAARATADARAATGSAQSEAVPAA